MKGLLGEEKENKGAKESSASHFSSMTTSVAIANRVWGMSRLMRVMSALPIDDAWPGKVR